jgi:hypothetical protein
VIRTKHALMKEDSMTGLKEHGQLHSQFVNV